MSDERPAESLALEWALLNALRIGLERIARKPRKSGHPLVAKAIIDDELSWHEDADGRFVFRMNGKEYVLHHLELEQLNPERN